MCCKQPRNTPETVDPAVRLGSALYGDFHLRDPPAHGAELTLACLSRCIPASCARSCPATNLRRRPTIAGCPAPARKKALFGLPATETRRRRGFTPLRPGGAPTPPDCTHRVASPDLSTSRLLVVHTWGERGVHPSFDLTGVGDVLAGHIRGFAATPWAWESDAQPSLPRHRAPGGAARCAVWSTRAGPAGARAALGLLWRARRACLGPHLWLTRDVDQPGTAIIIFHRLKPTHTARIL